MRTKILLITLFSFIIFSSCESEAEKEVRLEKEKIEILELKRIRIEHENAVALQKAEEERRNQEQERRERKEKEIYDRYINNSLSTGATPYSNCFGYNNSCSDNGCSEINVKTPYNSDVIVTIKKKNKVFRHAYIRASTTYSFEFPNGTYQVFFYYGKGWNPNKNMDSSTCSNLQGGFISNELFSKDSPQTLISNILTYELVLQENGNFSTKPSSESEAF